MALVLGVNCGFVTVAPVDDLVVTLVSLDTRARALKDVAPTGAVKVVEIGWWCDNATEEADTDVGIYSHDAANNRPLNLLSKVTFAKGTTSGWKKAAVDIDIVAGTIYWIAVQLDDTYTTTNTGTETVAGEKSDYKTAQTELPAAWGESTGTATSLKAFYAVYTTGPPPATNMYINISDTFKNVDSIKINIGDVWKDVIKVQINIGDAWKTVFGS